MLRRVLVLTATFAIRLAVAAAWLWSMLALFYHPWLPRWVGAVLAIGFGGGTIVLWQKLGDPAWALRYFAMAVAAVLIFSWLPRPTHRRPWSPFQAVMPTAEIDGDRILIRNLRRTGEGLAAEITRYDKEIDLGQLESIWFGVQHFSQWKSIAHTFISFGFAGGDYIAISVESRRPKGEGFSPLAGMFRNYGLIYVIGDELEVIGRRSLTSDDPIYLYPIKASDQQRRGMLLDMLRRANQLAERAEFYNTWTNNCTNNIVVHCNRIAPVHISPYSPRIALPGYTGRVAYDHGLIDSEKPFAELQQQAYINDLAREAADSEQFSTEIRARYGGSTDER